ncbi:MAG: glycoside hydrolase family 5 protein [Lachnospiraceae bacterium]|nr:glycoside hydrolase family 5 protein [Lachnospiraceae bacterium]
MKKLFRSLLSVSLVLAMVLSLCACGKKSDKANGTNSNGSGDKKEESTASPYASMNSIEFAAAMGNGTNLGNTFESTGGERNFSALAVSDMTKTVSINAAETLWGQPVTTKEMIDGLKTAGFDSIRIPVAWTKYMDNISTGDYTINPEFLDRVEEVVGWCRDAGLIVMINDHWDGGWWGMFGSEDQSEEAFKLYESMWSQIAERFKDYDEFLVFEGGNEEFGTRFNDSINGVVGKLSTEECYEMVTKVTQKFVDTVRAGEGYNKNRFLLIPGFNTNIDQTIDDKYVMPTDTVEGKLLISVHYYDPSTYCIGGSISYWGNESDVTYMNDQLAKMTKFTDAGYGVVIGEHAVANEAIAANENKAPGGIYEYFKCFLANCDKYGYAPYLWDCNNYYSKENAAWTTDEGFAELQQFYLDAQKSTPEDLAAAADATIAEVVAGAHEDPNAPQDIRENEDDSVAWLMFNSADWTVSYSVGDEYAPTSATSGLVPTDVVIEGEGEYTVSLDFSSVGGASGCVFMALGIANGEINFPDYKVEITEFKINDTAYPCNNYYTTSDDGTCTRVNLFNYWVTDTSKIFKHNDNNEEGRLVDGVTAETAKPWPIMEENDASNVPSAAYTFPEVANTISLTFKYYPA